MAYEINSTSADCYEGTTCLINKLNIHDEQVLSKIESEITLAKTIELENKPIAETFDISHYKAIHRYLFEDIYEWAGKFRKINISKKGTKFADYTELEDLCSKCFERLQKLNFFRDFSFNDFVENIVDLYCSLNYLHPFREANGRTERVFINQLINFCGYSISFSEIDSDFLMIATIQAAQGVTDNLTEIFKTYIKSN